MKKLMALVLSVAMVLCAVPASIFADTVADTPTSTTATDISTATIAAISDITYTGKAITPTIKVTLGTSELAATNYDVTYSANTNVGEATVTVTGKAPSYTGTVTAKFNIVAKNFRDSDKPEISIPTQLVGAEEITGVSITWNGNTLSEGTDFDVVKPAAALVAGTNTATINFKGNYSGTVTSQFNVVANDFSSAAIYFQQINQTYTFDGTAKTPAVRVELSGKTLTEGTDYTVSYSSNTNAGTAKVIVTGTGTYAGSKSVDFTINKAKLADAVLTISPSSYSSTGQAIMPTYTVKLGDYVLKTTDYTAAATNNINTGTATLTLTATAAGNFTGTLTGTFTIAGKDISTLDVTLNNATNLKYDGKEKTPTVTVKDGTTTLTLNKDYTVTYESNINAGTGKVIIKGAGTYAGEVTKTFVIDGTDNEITATSYEITKYLTSKVFNLNAVGHGDETGLTYVSSNEGVVKVSATGDVTVVGTGVAVITVATVGTKAYDPATREIVIKVKPLKPVFKLSTPAKKQVKVLITKVEGATRYEVEYGRNGKYYKKTIKHLDNEYTKTSTTLKNRASGKTYYVRVRAVKVMEDGTTVYGNWTARKAIKAK